MILLKMSANGELYSKYSLDFVFLCVRSLDDSLV